MADPIEAGEQKVSKLLKSEPWYVWAGAAGAAGVMLYFVWKRRQAAATTANNTPGMDTTLPATDPTASVVPAIPTGYNISSGPVDNYPELQSGTSTVPVVPFGMTPIYDASGNLIGWQQPNPVQSPAPAPPPTPTPGPPTPSQPPTGIFPPGPNPIPAPQPQPSPQPIEEEKIYTVQHGDNLSEIMAKLHLHGGWPALYNNRNNRAIIGPDPNLVYAGERLDYTGLGNGGIGGGSLEGGHRGGGSIETGMGGGFHLPINAGRNTIDQWIFSNGMHTSPLDQSLLMGE